ncbi:MAG: hypothetical protein FD166_3514 [Bacteroidetes bacterium]|nr:MAG: hypothetical protein FD166_3514 [Bacteroidota bacterium]
MKKVFTKTILLIGLILIVCTQKELHSATLTSTQTGYFSSGTTWTGGIAPAPGDDIIIMTGHTVILDMNAQVRHITIQNGAVLDNGNYYLEIYSTSPGANPVYANFGSHNGTGNFVTYDGGPTSITGTGTLNCNIEIQSYGLNVLNSCNLIINGNIQHSVPGNNGMNGKEFIGCWQTGSNITINGDIITDEQYTVGISTVAGTSISVNGNVILPGGLSSGGGSSLTNSGEFNISGNLVLGPYSGFCQNLGTMSIGGDLIGAYDTYYIQEMNSITKFGGRVFPDGDGFLFAVESPLTGSSQPNTIVYNGTSAQNINLPSDMAFSNLVVGNVNAVATIATDILVYGDIIIKPGSALTVNSGSTLTYNGSMILESDATGTGSFISNTDVSANVQRYIIGHNGVANNGWHMLSSPVTNQGIAEFHIPGSGDDFYKWDEASSMWINRTSTGGGLNGSFETNFNVGEGYLVAYSMTDTKTFTGSLNYSDLNVSGLGVSTNNPYSGWHLLGNPFSSSLIWNDGNWSLNNIDANCQVWNENNASYSVLTANSVIPSMNGFMVHANGENASLSIPAISRVHNNLSWQKNTNENERIVLTAIDAEGGTSQPTIIRFDNSASEGYDNNLDSYFLAGFAPYFYSISQQKSFALNSLPEFNENISIPLGFIKNDNENFTIEMSENITGLKVYLTDYKTNCTTILNDGSYTFSSDQNDDANRFLLHLGTLGIEDTYPANTTRAWMTKGQMHFSGLNECSEVSIYDIQGRLLQRFNVNPADEQAISLNLSHSIFIVRIANSNGSDSFKIINQ